ncbi:MAG: glycine zipper 2TM domain-containing protein [Burkholderiales bacterium]|nr:glycine zipper 2TM domain-containing protein [Burkholderiales bacterium]
MLILRSCTLLSLAALALGAPLAAAAATCADCGVVTSLRYVEEKGQASGVGAVAGGVVGGVVGHQFGSGRGNTAMTIAGAGAGAYAGHQIEKNKNKKVYWAVTVKMDDGTVRKLTYSQRPPANEGERVKLLDGGKRMALVAP